MTPRATPSGGASWAARRTSTSPSRPRAATSTRRIRGALSTAALSAARFAPILRACSAHLLAAGKKKMIALTAVMRKLILLLNRLRKNSNFKLRAAA